MVSNKMKNGLKIAILGLLALIALLIALCNYDSQYSDYGRKAEYLSNRGYARVFKVNRLNYQNLFKKYGMPIKEETQAIPEVTDRRVVFMQYPSFELYCVEYQETDGTVARALYLLIVLDDTLQFGRNQIGIGSTREDVHRAYANDPAISVKELAYSAEDYPNVDEGFYGEDWSRILFCYDDNGVVESMAYQPPAF